MRSLINSTPVSIVISPDSPERMYVLLSETSLLCNEINIDYKCQKWCGWMVLIFSARSIFLLLYVCLFCCIVELAFKCFLFFFNTNFFLLSHTVVKCRLSEPHSFEILLFSGLSLIWVFILGSRDVYLKAYGSLNINRKACKFLVCSIIPS